MAGGSRVFSRVPNALRLDQPWQIIIKARMVTVGFAVLMIRFSFILMFTKVMLLLPSTLNPKP